MAEEHCELFSLHSYVRREAVSCGEIRDEAPASATLPPTEWPGIGHMVPTSPWEGTRPHLP